MHREAEEEAVIPAMRGGVDEDLHYLQQQDTAVSHRGQ